MSAQVGPGGFNTIESRPDYYIEFLDARTAIDDETRVKQVIIGLLQAQDGVEVLDVGTGTGDDARTLAALVAPHGKRYFLEAGLEDVHCSTQVIQNSVAFMRIVFANRLGAMVDAGETTAEEVTGFWAELELAGSTRSRADRRVLQRGGPQGRLTWGVAVRRHSPCRG